MNIQEATSILAFDPRAICIDANQEVFTIGNYVFRLKQ